MYQKIRSSFGKYIECQDTPAQCDCDIPPNAVLQDVYMTKNPCMCERWNVLSKPPYLSFCLISSVSANRLDINCVPGLSEHSANTEVVHFAAKGMNHEEGGWPRDVDAAEPEQKARYTKKMEKDEDYIKSMEQQAIGLIHAMRQVRICQICMPTAMVCMLLFLLPVAILMLLLSTWL